MNNNTMRAEQLDFFNTNGYLVIEDMTSLGQVKECQAIYNRFLDGSIDTDKNRVNPGTGLGKNDGVENITQIMCSCDFVPELLQMEYHNLALSCWSALDAATVSNGCMWYVPGSHLQPLRPHWPAGMKGGALTCEATEQEGLPIAVKPGTCVNHHGAALHYSCGDTTSSDSRHL